LESIEFQRDDARLVMFVQRVSDMTPKRADACRAWGASILLHVGLLIGLSAVVWHQELVVSQPAIDSQIVAADPDPEILLPDINLEEFLRESGSPAVGEPHAVLPVAAPLGSGLSLSGPVGLLSGERGIGRGGAGDGLGIGFFGARTTGRSVVFVVDMSNSMEGARFSRAQQELVSSIEQLHVSQKFFVIFFDTRAFPMFFPRAPKELVSATPGRKRSVTRWIQQRRTGNGTDPEGALVRALALKPDVIYFLTDGEFPERCRQVVKEGNTSGTTIHTIAFQSHEGIPLLEAIAQDHHGTFKLVE
jgi:hypothetical protein